MDGKVVKWFWLNGGVFVYEQSGCGLIECCI